MSNREVHITPPEVDRHEDSRTTVHDVDICTYSPEYSPFTSEGAKRTYPREFAERMDNDGDEGTGNGEFYPNSGDPNGKSSLG